MLTARLNDTGNIATVPAWIGKMSLGSDASMVFTYFDQGQVVSTGSKLDLAIKDSGSSFFTVTIPDENGNMKEYYTRDGAFSLNSQMQLVNKEGYLVMGEDGPIVLNGEDFMVQEDGTVVQNGAIVGKLLIRSFTDPLTLRKIGDNLLDRTVETQEKTFDGVILQGSLERSNVNVIKEMVNMINVMRIYETNQKLLTAQDGTLEKVVNEVGILR